MTEETKAKLLALSGNQAVADAIDAHVRAVVEEMRAEPDNRMRVQRLIDANVDVSKERDRLLARVAELEASESATIVTLQRECARLSGR